MSAHLAVTPLNVRSFSRTRCNLESTLRDATAAAESKVRSARQIVSPKNTSSAPETILGTARRLENDYGTTSHRDRRLMASSNSVLRRWTENTVPPATTVALNDRLLAQRAGGLRVCDLSTQCRQRTPQQPMSGRQRRWKKVVEAANAGGEGD